MGLKSDKQGMLFAASAKPVKPPSNVSKVGKFRSIGVFGIYENPGGAQTFPIMSCDKAPFMKQEMATGDVASCGAKTYPNACAHLEISKLFDSLSALKLAYVKLQEAHIPYDPMKIRASDEEVVSLLETICTIKRAYKERLSKEVNCVSSSSSHLLAEIQVQERVLEKLKSRVKSKCREVASLRGKLHELDMRNKKLAEEIRECERESFMGLHCSSFENVVKEAGKAIHDFAKPLIALMKLSGWDLDRAANAVQESVVYSKRSHKKYAFEAYVAWRMFYGFSEQPCFSKNVMNFDNPIIALMDDPRSSFADFCRTKYMLVVHPKMEECFFGNLDHRNLMAKGIHPNTQFYHAFVRMARWVWYLNGFAAFIEPKAEIFGVKQGSDFSDIFMEVVEELKEYKAGMNMGQERCKVEFMVMPGFKLGKTVIKSQVFVSRRPLSKGTH
ncbi:Plant protein of unknown function (DUF641 [Striga hermonthica]|uniref:DUF641 domain-containing protein n=1 Tax=Striga hermonthica TaxID=68872 RepID=A0A9N7RSR1_STRHE|nr:Plant protein of unknown function (DUF641 [Striga hermonthica]